MDSMIRTLVLIATCCVALVSTLEPVLARNNNFVTICHVPPGNPDNEHTITVNENAVDAHLAHGDRLGSCDDAQVGFVVDVQGDRFYGTVNTTFDLSGVALPAGEHSVVDYHWTVSDGRIFSTPDVSLNFDQPGFYSVTLQATSDTGETGTARVGVIVHDHANPSPDIFSIPDPMGDVNRDGQVNLLDAHLAAKFTGRLEQLPEDPAQEAANMDFDSEVTFDDVSLIASAALNNAPLPDQLLSDRGAPGSVVTLVSPHLLNADDLVEIVIGTDNQVRSVSRPVLGYVSFIMPFTGAAAAPGEQAVRLLVNGSEVSRYSFTVTAPAAVPADPVAELHAFLDEMQQLLLVNESLVASQLEGMPLTDQARATLQAGSTAGRMEVQRIITELEAVLAQPGGDGLAELFFISANANGLPEYRARLQAFLASTSQGGTLDPTTMASISPDEVCDQLLPALCALKFATGLVEDGSGIISTSCDVLLALALGAAVIPADGPLVDGALLTLWATVCAPLELALDVSAVFTGLISDIDADLRLDIENNAPAAGEVATITAALDVFGLDDVCQIAGSQGADKLVEKLAEQAVGRLIRRKITVRAMTRIFTELGEDFLQRFLDLLESAASEVITATGLDQAILDFAQPYCEDIFGAELVMNANRVLSGPEPNEGTLNFLSDGRAEYMCPEDSSTSGTTMVMFTAEKEICDMPQMQMAAVTCESRDVTITMGDNGSANDDIYEVRVNGETVLTSSSPVRSISTTIQLPAGSMADVQMLGRAAPDGIGTYFIRFSGATVISGDATSGTDLTPGTVKNYVIQVQE